MTDNKKIRVLLVEDEPDTRCVVGIYLRKLSFDVHEAENGRVALLKVYPSSLGLDEPPIIDVDVILLDLLMPVMDGFDFLRRYPGPVPVIVMSGWSDMKELPRQPYARVTKPASMLEVAPLLQAAAAGWR
jgi:CheY-like chemotaxis protein